MAKSTHAAGGSFTEHELSDENPPPQIVIHREMLGGVPQSPGDNSRQSSESESKLDESSTHNPPPPVQTTDSPSSQTQKTGTDSGAHSTAGRTRTTGKVSARKPTRNRRRPAEVGDDEFDDI